ncbi:MAG: biopolymer transporter ExbD [Proteobacteria bacterium]|nr:biopolymer transporter ExbD [Pseudomonadota bacterium]
MGIASLDREDFSAPMAEINTTPLVDVMLVLLVIFLVTAPMLTQAVKLQLPNEVATVVADKNPVVISVTSEGNYYWGEELIGVDTMAARLQETAATDTKRAIHLRADANAPYGKVSKVLVTAQRYGLHNIGFITEPK